MEFDHESCARDIVSRVLREFGDRVSVKVDDPVVSSFTELEFSSVLPEAARLFMIVRGDLAFQAFACGRELFESPTYEDPLELADAAVAYACEFGRHGLVYTRRSPLGRIRPRFFGIAPGPAGKVLRRWGPW